MQITFFGTSGGVPTRRRNVAGIAVRLPQRGEWWLMDCGEATQHQILRSDLSFSQLTRIFITHLHGDHIYGLPGLLATGRLAGNAPRTHIYAPVGIEEYLRACWQLTNAGDDFPVEIHIVKEGTIYEDEEFIVTCRAVEHRVEAYAYAIAERDRPGRFLVEEAEALGVPFGALYGKLKRGEIVTLEDGRRIDGRTLTAAPEQGRRIAYSGDTTYCRAMVELAHDADVLIHEATFSARDAELARRSSHSTATMAARVAVEAEVKSLLLTHFSPRYARGTSIEPEDLLREAQEVFPATAMARDMLRIEIPRRRDVEENVKGDVENSEVINP
ncbi:MAG: ribonuclease Z [Pyrinomonadaceae bacterium MAG19_C2-C3]|nr:ribonuclease Z [Pyrinomonadaceae bacterium MAG19_C2-C3]